MRHPDRRCGAVLRGDYQLGISDGRQQRRPSLVNGEVSWRLGSSSILMTTFKAEPEVIYSGAQRLQLHLFHWVKIHCFG
jgi:hypothetical protein